MNESTEAKAILQGDDELSEGRIKEESKFTNAITSFLQDQADRIADIAIDGDMPKKDFWDNETELLATFLGVFLVKWAEDGISEAVDRLGTVGLGVPDDANGDAEKWAASHSRRLARSLNRTTRTLAEARINLLMQKKTKMEPTSEGDIIRKALRQAIAPKWRGALIAATEITRTIGNVGRIIWRRVPGVNHLVWYTRRDERVCPICQPLHGTVTNKKGVFPGGYVSPPAHPKCRCDVSYEV